MVTWLLASCSIDRTKLMVAKSLLHHAVPGSAPAVCDGHVASRQLAVVRLALDGAQLPAVRDHTQYINRHLQNLSTRNTQQQQQSVGVAERNAGLMVPSCLQCVTTPSTSTGIIDTAGLNSHGLTQQHWQQVPS
jgi:hypothetical protein